MPDILTPGCAVVNVQGTTDGPFPWAFTFHAQHPSGVSPIPAGDLLNLAESVGTNPFAALLRGMLPESYALTQVTARDVGEVRSPGVPLVVVGGEGTNTGTALPAAVSAVVLELISPTAAQRKGGRISFPGVVEANATASSDLTAAAVILYQSLATSLLTAVNTASAASGTWTMVVRSTELHGVPRTAGVVTPVVDVTPRTRLGTEVSRQRGKRSRR